MSEAAWALATIAGVVLLGSASPGPNFVAVSASALASRQAGLLTAAGVATASVTWATLGVTGLALVVSGSPALYEALRWAGATYLLYLTVRLFLGLRRAASKLPSTPDAPLPVTSGVAAWSKGYFVNMGNPKTAAFVASFFLSALPANGPAWLYVAAVAVAGAVSLAWYGFVAVLLSRPRVSAAYMQVRFWIDLAFATALLAMSVLLVLA